MKLKNSKENIKLSSMLPVAYISTLLLVILRTFQTARFIDSETGFTTGAVWLEILIYVVLAAVCIYFALVSFVSAQGGKIELNGVKDKAAAVASVAFAVSLLYDWVDSFVNGATIFDGLSVSYFNRASDALKILMSSGALPYVLQSLFALLSAIYMVIVAKSFISGRLIANKHKYIALAPIAWAGFKMITRFVKQISYIKVSDLFLELMLIAVMLLFFVALSQVFSGVYSDDSRWRIGALGLSGGVIAFCINVPRFVFTVFAGDFVNREYPFSLDDTMFGLFALFVALAAVRSVEQNKEQA